MKSPIRIAMVCITFLLLTLLAWLVFIPPYPRSQLPSTAAKIYDYDTSRWFSVQTDYFYLLTAEIDEAEFQTFITDIGFTESDLDVDWWPNMNGFDWWTPQESSLKIYASNSRWKPNAAAKYEAGKLYYKEWSGY